MTVERPPSLFAGVEPLEVFVELLADLDDDTSAIDFYDRICEAICRLTTMRRAAIFMSDAPGRAVLAVGAYGTSFRELLDLQPTPTLLATPIAQRALLRDEVVVVTDEIAAHLPPEYAERFSITTLVCTPLSAAGHTYGVICADRGGERFELNDGERHLLWTLGKTAALVATARNATRQQERTRQLDDRLELAREIHERVMQRLFGVSLALGAESGLDPDQRERCRVEMQEALADLRSALERPLAPFAPSIHGTLADALAQASESRARPLHVDWPAAVVVPAAAEPIAQSVLAEALRNVAKHADASRIDVRVARDGDTFALEVVNDGVRATARGTGMGLRLAGFEALQHGGMVEFGPAERGCWRVRLVMPVGAPA